MEMVPVEEPGITIPTKEVPVLETTMAVAPPIVKAVGLPKLVPVMVTKVPGLPLEGVKDVMVGVCAHDCIKIPEHNIRKSTIKRIEAVFGVSKAKFLELLSIFFIIVIYSLVIL